MKSVILKIYETYKLGDKQITGLKKVIPAVLYENKKLIKPESGEKEILCTHSAQIFKKVSLSGNEKLKIGNTRYSIIQIKQTDLFKSISLFLTEIAGDY